MSTHLHHPHDQFFKHAFGIKEVMMDFLSSRLPARAFASIDPSSLRLTNKGFSGDSRLRYESDVVYQAKINDQEGYLYLLCEQQSRVDRYMPLRFMEYNVQLMRQHLNEGYTSLPLILNICVYNGKRRYHGPLGLLAMSKNPVLIQEYLLQDFHLIDLHREPEEAILRDKKAAFAELLLRQGITRDFFLFLKRYEDLFMELFNKGDIPYAEMAILYILDRDRDKQVEAKIATINPAFKKMIMSAAQKLIQEGRQEGEQIGVMKGRQEGELLKAKSIAQSMLLKGCSTSLIAEVTELSIEEIEGIRLR